MDERINTVFEDFVSQPFTINGLLAEIQEDDDLSADAKQKVAAILNDIPEEMKDQEVSMITPLPGNPIGTVLGICFEDIMAPLDAMKAKLGIDEDASKEVESWSKETDDFLERPISANQLTVELENYSDCPEPLKKEIFKQLARVPEDDRDTLYRLGSTPSGNPMGMIGELYAIYVLSSFVAAFADITEE